MYFTKQLHAKFLVIATISLGVTIGCSPASENAPKTDIAPLPSKDAVLVEKLGKPVVYQVFTRLFGNKNLTNKAWGSIDENGVGKFSDFTDTALQGIKELGTTHVWYTGVPHHDLINNYSAYGISQDDPDVVKGRAGSPYAVKDYYSVNPDLADDPAKRVEEFEALIERTHKNGMQVIIDIVPNHVARNYQSLAKPAGVADFGENDNTDVEYARDNNFYYVVGEDFKVPQSLDGYQPLGGEKHPLSDGEFTEKPAKWTGNGSRLAQPHFHDWYETVKVNYGVKPDGSYDFERLPEEYRHMDASQHHAFWANKKVPDSWNKFRDIAHYWLAKGVDGFRYDMAEMVPVEFWSYMNSSIKMKNPKAFLLAEVYNPKMYRDYIQLGKMDYLYDKVEFYDTLKAIMQGKGNTDDLARIQLNLQDIEQHMLHFLENHDEQRIASPDFAGSALPGKPAIVASALISRSPTLLYFAQEVGEDGSEAMGFGTPSRTTIFDYAGVPAHQRWMNEGKFDGGKLSADEKALRDYYVKVMNISAYHPAMQGNYASISSSDIQSNLDVTKNLLAFTRWKNESRLLVVSNFNNTQSAELKLNLSAATLGEMGLRDDTYSGVDLMTTESYILSVEQGEVSLTLALAPLQSVVIHL
ncbi:MAG: glycosidase [Paraglaciecola sp.]|jgi:glycosidase